MRLLVSFIFVIALSGQPYRLGEAIQIVPGSPKTGTERQAAGQAAIPATWYDTTNRAAVAEAYKVDFLPTRLIGTGWTGNVAAGNAGDVSLAYRNAVNQRVNWFRAMAGVPAWVTFDSTYNGKAQKGALMLAANNALSHNPPTTWQWYTAEGAEALGSSNVCQGSQDDPGCVAQYVADQYANNTAAGHRRWILYPQTRLMGTGDIPHNRNLWNALWIMDPNYGTARPSTRDTFVAWPPKGYVPYQVVYPRWSFSYPGADFSSATVSMTRNGAPVSVALHPVQSFIGENTLVWVPEGRSTDDRPAPLPPAGDTVYNVAVNNVRIGGVPQNFTYQVIAFDPAAGVVVSPDPPAASVPTGGVTNAYFFTHLDPPNAPLPTPVASANWIQVVSVPQSGEYVFYNVSPNNGPSRTGTITMGSTAHTITQAGTGGGCAFTTSSNAITVSPDDTSGQFALTASSSPCPWTASSDRSWLQVFPLSGTSGAPIYYTVFPNFSSVARSGTITVAGHSFTVTQQAGVGTASERFIRLLYFNYFGRLPPQAEIAFQLGSGQSRQQLAFNFLNSAEFNNAGRFVAGLYVGILNRDAEYGGWLFQRNALSRGQTNTDVLVANFLNSAEFTSRNGNLSHADLVRLLYRQILGREASAAEVTWREGLLNGSLTRVSFARDLLSSNEFRQGKNARLLAFLFYATLLNRGPGSAEYVLRRDQIAANSSDATVRAILTDIVNSTEFGSMLQ